MTIPTLDAVLTKLHRALDQITTLCDLHVERPAHREVTVHDIVAAVAAAFDMSRGDLMSRRTKPALLARAVAMYLARRHTQLSYLDLGETFAHTHAAVIAAVEKTQGRLTVDHALRRKVTQIEATVSERSAKMVG